MGNWIDGVFCLLLNTYRRLQILGWVGTWEDLENGSDGQYSVRLKDNKKGYDTTYPGVEVLPDDTFVVTTYGHWSQGEQPYILSVRFKLSELDTMAK